MDRRTFVKERRAAKRTSTGVANVLAKRGLSVSQRLAVHALVMSTTPGEALKLLHDKGIDVDRVVLNRWLGLASFRTALQAAEAAVAESITKHSVLRKTEMLLEAAMTPQPILHQGEDTGFREIELGAATRLVELQGKATGLFQDDVATKVAVLIDIDFSGRKDTPAPAAPAPPIEDAVFTESLEAAAQAVLEDETWLG